MKMHVRLFEPKEIFCTQELDGENIPIPRLGEIIYINDHPCKVSDVSYTYNDLARDTCDVDITTVNVPDEWWGEVYKEIEEAKSSRCECDCGSHNNSKKDHKSDYDYFNELLDQLDKLSETLYDKFRIKTTRAGDK